MTTLRPIVYQLKKLSIQLHDANSRYSEEVCGDNEDCEFEEYGEEAISILDAIHQYNIAHRDVILPHLNENEKMLYMIGHGDLLYQSLEKRGALDTPIK